MAGIRVALEPVSPAEYAGFVDAQIEEYAEQKVRAGHWRPEDATSLSRHAVEGFLPRTGAVRGHRVWKVLGPDGGARIGWIWTGPPPLKALDVPTRHWLYQITIEPSDRGKGFGRAALQATEALLASEGVTELYLNVFRWNTAARSLYDTSGYVAVYESETETGMKKLLRRSEE